MIDKTEIECRFRRSVDSYEDNATVQKWIVQRLVELLQEYVPYSSRTLEIGCGTGLLSEKINRLWEDQQFLFLTSISFPRPRDALFGLHAKTVRL